MNMIFRLILEIFQAIFEEDAKNRRGPKPPPPPKQPKQGQGKGKSRDLDAWIDDLLDDERPPEGSEEPVAVTYEPVLAPTPEPILQPAPVAAYETTEQHMQDTAAGMASISRHVTQYMGEDHFSQPRRQQQAFKLPGKTPLEQLVLAQVILGPCKGASRRARRF